MICFNWLNAVRYLWPRGPSLGLSVCGLVLHNERTSTLERTSSGLLPLLPPPRPPLPSPLAFSARFLLAFLVFHAFLPLSLSPPKPNSSSPQVLRGLVPSAPDLFDYLEIGRSFIPRASHGGKERVKSRFSSAGEEKPRAIHKYRATTSGSLLPRMIYKRLSSPRLFPRLCQPDRYPTLSLSPSSKNTFKNISYPFLFLSLSLPLSLSPVSGFRPQLTN